MQTGGVSAGPLTPEHLDIPVDFVSEMLQTLASAGRLPIVSTKRHQGLRARYRAATPEDRARHRDACQEDRMEERLHPARPRHEEDAEGQVSRQPHRDVATF